MIKNFDDWNIYEGAAEGSGRSEKIWLEKDGIIGIFKFPKQFVQNGEKINETTKEYLAEKIASLIAKKLEIQSADVDIGTRNGRIGSMSYNILKKEEILVEGIQFISSYKLNYNQETLYDSISKEYYNLEMIENSIKNVGLKKVPKAFYKMLIFDFIIGNNDRHQNNWGFIFKFTPDKLPIIQTRFSPLYDNGSSLCSFIKEKDIYKYIQTNDKMLINSLVDTKSKSMIGIDSKNKKRPTQLDVIKYLKQRENSDIIKYIDFVVNQLNDSTISELIDSFNNDIISENRKKLLKIYLNKKIELLKSVFYGEGDM